MSVVMIWVLMFGGHALAAFDGKGACERAMSGPRYSCEQVQAFTRAQED